MKRYISLLFLTIPLIFSSGCSTSYKVKPLLFKSPATLKNVVSIAGADVAVRAFVDKAETKEAFGFDIHGAGMLPEPPWEVPPRPMQAMSEDQLSMTYVKNLFKIRQLSRKALPTTFCFSQVKPNRPSSFASS